MTDAVRLWTGWILLIGGLLFLIIPFVGWIYGLIGIILGIVILRNKGEDSIEERRDVKGGSKK